MFRWAKIVLAVSVLFGLVTLGLGLTTHITSYNYSGRLAFQTENDYSQFKSFLVSNPEIQLLAGVKEPQKLVVLSSAPPIVVEYNGLNVPSEIVFPFAYQDKSMSSIDKEGFIIGFGIPAFLGILMSILAGVKKWNQ